MKWKYLIVFCRTVRKQVPSTMFPGKSFQVSVNPQWSALPMCGGIRVSVTFRQSMRNNSAPWAWGSMLIWVNLFFTCQAEDGAIYDYVAQGPSYPWSYPWVRFWDFVGVRSQRSLGETRRLSFLFLKWIFACLVDISRTPLIGAQAPQYMIGISLLYWKSPPHSLKIAV